MIIVVVKCKGISQKGEISLKSGNRMFTNFTINLLDMGLFPVILLKLKHHLNPLHLYCRLRNIGIRKETAIFLCRFYERMVFNLFMSIVRFY
jgi:hypothetical protein